MYNLSLEILITILIVHLPPVKEIDQEWCTCSYGKCSPIAYKVSDAC